ncbi:dTDP-glucose 4,6-dehydratase [Prosthecobacter fusiformis]|uniref:dTDP-glucose 4,6-dehydratase n=1 Tax=Prosthecobacter fusiformis TaxID=48464 RepID=A0A4V3FE62_9BACT|nr:dTDP-glucose 4,6-dehydratase [Prosthecobacter fusiformis]TDU64630.1 dTDP-glucose 4,6-dehydratase [Prosthecobacter fusiformis]
MRLLVTGGAGFIGSNLIRHIIDLPGIDQLINLDALTYAGNLQNLEGIHEIHPKYAFEHVNLTDVDEVERVVRTHAITHVIHLAAESHVDRSIQNASPFMQTNVMGTLHLLDACRAVWKNPESHRFIQVSTDEVYGSLGPAEAPFTEDSPLQPNSPYAASKAAAECLVRSYVKTYGFPAIITRSCNNYGPNQHPEKLIPTVLTCLRDRCPIPVYGNGQQTREWIHVTDHAEALWQVLEKGVTGEVYNIGTGDEWTNLKLIEHLCDIWDETHQSSSSRQLISHVTDRPGHDQRYAIDASKIMRVTGCGPCGDSKQVIRKLTVTG